MNKIKKSWRTPTVKIAVIAVLAAIACLFLPWLKGEDITLSLMTAVRENPAEYTGVLPLIMVSALWVIFMFLLNHPKLTLVGDLPLIFILAGFFILDSDSETKPGFGRYLYLAAVLVCVICAFLTRKRREKNAA